ncbi:MAG: hypothetical protein QW707_02755 [Candidatus Bathyarchaeia archaeon]
MQTEQKTLLERAVDALPDPIREAYEAAPRKGSEAHEVLRLLVAMYLWSNGYGSISFEKCVNHNGVQNMCVDIYEDTLNLFVECERFPDKKAIADRQKAIKDVYSTAKFVLATQDRMGWRALRLRGVADEVWVVCRDGRVLTPAEWAEERRKMLKTIFNPIELGGYMNLYGEAEEEYHKFRRLLDEEGVLWGQLLNQACLKTAEFRVEWLKDLSVRGVWCKHVEDAKNRMEEAKTKIVAKVVELLNAIVSLSSPYTFRLSESGVIEVGVDWDAWQWLGWKDYPNKSPVALAQYQLLEENIRKELKMATGNARPKPGNSNAKVKGLIEHDRTFKEMQKDIEEIKKLIPLLAQRTQPAAAQQPTRTM